MSDKVGPVDPPLVAEAVLSPKQRVTVTRREWVADIGLLLIWLAFTDWLLYRIGTRVSWGLFFIGAILFLAFLKYKTAHRFSSLAIAMLLGMLSLKLIWCGSELQIACGLLLLLCYAMALTGLAPFFPEVVGFFGSIAVGAAKRIRATLHDSFSTPSEAIQPSLALQLLLPLAVVSIFATLFVLANPDLANAVHAKIQLGSKWLLELIAHISLGEVVFLVVSACALLGMLYPSTSYLLKELQAGATPATAEPVALRRAYRNTLVCVILLFAAYLIFEFTTLWFREFPEEFYYAGYAHRGALWLTIALAFATLVLSLMFQGAALYDPQIAFLKRLAVLWSIENLLLSAAVYNRLFIYIDFNGMTRLRLVGLLGITSVVAGFILVVIKLWRDRDVIWLIHRQLWVPTLAIVIYAILPVDWIVNNFNVQQVLSDNPAPSVQIVAHETSPEGVLPLFALVDTPDATIREGVRALLALWAIELGVERDMDSAAIGREEPGSIWRSPLGHSTPWLSSPRSFSQDVAWSMSSPHPKTQAWQEYQISQSLLREGLEQARAKWSVYAMDRGKRQDALNAYFEYAYQWY